MMIPMFPIIDWPNLFVERSLWRHRNLQIWISASRQVDFKKLFLRMSPAICVGVRVGVLAAAISYWVILLLFQHQKNQPTLYSLEREYFKKGGSRLIYPDLLG